MASLPDLANTGIPKRAHSSSRKPQGGNTWKPKKTKREKNITAGSNEDVLKLDILALLESSTIASKFNGEGTDGVEIETDVEDSLPAEGTETDVEVLDISSTGDGLAMRKGSNQVYVVPFTVPGDIARVKVFRHHRALHHTEADFISITKPSALRDDTRVQCKYFASCGGCQFQMLDYSEQQRLKRRIVEKAYRNFANLPAELIPTVQDTIGSPLQYSYRTKLTPHFDGPPGFRPSKKKNPNVEFETCPDVGFMVKGRRRVQDIETCPIGTEAVRLGMTSERARMQQEFKKYKKGATLLLRETTTRVPKGEGESPSLLQTDETGVSCVRAETDEYVDVKTCETNHNATTTEYVDGFVFTNPAGSFFQNNNSILPKFTGYIREHILPPSGNINYLIDAYSGSGLFTITLSSVFKHSTGIDIADNSIKCARQNAKLNGLDENRCKFIAADAGQLFSSITYNPDETVVVLDPPRKGCDAAFLDQLRKFGPKRIVYVSCNVHTQARDVGVLVRGEGSGQKYEIESLVGFDFFPQTGHVEGVAILNRALPDEPLYPRDAVNTLWTPKASQVLLYFVRLL